MKSCPACKRAFPFDYTHCPRDGSSLITVGDWAEGTLVRGKYRILAKVGQGGMGSVYKAMHVRFKEVRAIKVISAELASDASFLRRFEQEAIITRKLQHANAVRVEDIDEAEDGRPFIVMEYIEGRSLKDVIEQEAPLPVARVCSIIKQAAAALEAGHTLGLVHRDIKPANIALIPFKDEAGALVEHVKILDFGIAKLKETHLHESKTSHLSRLTLTDTGVVIGTPAYMSPEQVRGMKGDQLDGRSDIYSLGIVMYQMLTGDLPLKAESTIEQLMAHINVKPKPIPQVSPRIPGNIAAAVMRCLEKNRELRFPDGCALINELALSAGSSTESRTGIPQPASSTAKSKRSAQKVRKASRGDWWFLGSAIFIGLAFLGSVLYLQRNDILLGKQQHLTVLQNRTGNELNPTNENSGADVSSVDSQGKTQKTPISQNPVVKPTHGSINQSPQSSISPLTASEPVQRNRTGITSMFVPSGPRPNPVIQQDVMGDLGIVSGHVALSHDALAARGVSN